MIWEGCVGVSYRGTSFQRGVHHVQGVWCALRPRCVCQVCLSKDGSVGGAAWGWTFTYSYASPATQGNVITVQASGMMVSSHLPDTTRPAARVCAATRSCVAGCVVLVGW
jgi:hypothetical protein